MNNDLVENKMKFKDYLLVSSMLFALFFGAGNLIFPLHLGQMAGHNWVPAVLGFLVTGVLLPLLSVLAVSVTKSKGVYDIGLPLGSGFALAFMVLVHATIGPLFGTPRTATVSFTVGVAPLLPAGWQKWALVVFSALFFLAAFALSYRQNKIVANLGKVLNPLFLALLVLVFFVAFLKPMGNPAQMAATSDYLKAPFTNGFLQGYNTMDALAGLAFGVTVVTAIKMMKKKQNVSATTAKAGVLSMAAMALIYVLLTAVGAMSLGKFKLSVDGGVAFSQVVTGYAGTLGQAVLAALIVVTCLTTAVGLVAAFAQDFHNYFPQLSYHQWLALNCLVSFLTANFGLQQIIAWSTPVLMFLYPLAMVLIVLSVTSPLFKRDGRVYFMVVLFTVVPAFFDMVVSFPSLVSQSAFGKAVAAFRLHYLPLAGMGLSWVLPALAGLVLGLAWHLVRQKNESPAGYSFEQED